MNKSFKIFLTILSFIISQFILGYISDTLDLKNIIYLSQSYTVRYAPGVEEKFDSFLTYIGWLSVVYSFLIAYIVYAFCDKGYINQLEKLSTKYILFFSFIILVPADFFEKLIESEINNNYVCNILSLIIVGLVIISMYMAFRIYSFSKAKTLGFKIFEMTCIGNNFENKYYFEAKTREDVVKIIEDNKYIFSSYEKDYIKTICVNLDLFSLSFKHLMKCNNRIICSKLII